MNNKNIDTAIKAYLEGNRNEEFISVIAEWIKDNPKNARTFADIQDIVASYKMRDRFSSENIEKAYKKIERKISVSKNDDNNIQSIKKSSRPYHKIFRYAACIAATALIGYITFFILNITNNPKLLVARTANEVRIINLSDGSVVWLNRNSELHYPKIFKGPERNVSLTGEAYFEVGANKDFPFVVSSNGMDVKAIGTAFNFNTELANNIEEIDTKIEVPENIMFLENSTKKDRKNAKNIFVEYLPIAEKMKLKKLLTDGENIYSDYSVNEIL